MKMKFSEYLDNKALSSHALMDILISKKYFDYRRESQSRTESMVLGSAIHKMVLEPDSFFDDYSIAPDCDRRTKKGKEDFAEFCALSNGKEVLTKNDELTCAECALAVRGHNIAKSILTGAMVEESYFWEESGMKFKARPDIIRKDLSIVADLKTVDRLDVSKFGRIAVNYMYHVQGSHNLAGCSIVDGIKYKNFVLIVVERNPPFDVCVFNMSEAFLEIGDKTRAVAIERARFYEENPTSYSGAAANIVELHPPVWAE